MRYGAIVGTLIASIAVTTVPAHADTYYVYTGQSNAQTQIDVNHTSSWTFTTGNVPYALGGGNFTLKEGPQTTANITLSLYQGSSAAGTLVSQISLTNTQFDALYAPPVTNPAQNTQSFTLVPIHFAAPFTLAANSQYFLALTSTAVDSQSRAYFIKGYDTFSITTPDGQPTPPDVQIPEPAATGLLMVGLAGLAAARRQRACPPSA